MSNVHPALIDFLQARDLSKARMFAQRTSAFKVSYIFIGYDEAVLLEESEVLLDSLKSIGVPGYKLPTPEALVSGFLERVR